ncbi:hypothetical protein PSHT_00447 [Puccinia striiformis]|uniref:Uncharacterized protein n=1 Tax=Puccinia striiformis TaxID=27350 RepID=A0A2S4WN89_9BASI|nr:hypothetical protein PSHT_00447 [Puccinia striiformis]
MVIADQLVRECVKCSTGCLSRTCSNNNLSLLFNSIIILIPLAISALIVPDWLSLTFLSGSSRADVFALDFWVRPSPSSTSS